MNPRRFQVLLVLMALVPVGTADGEVLGTRSALRRAFEGLAHVNIPGGMAHGENSNTPVSVPLDPWSFPWELEITDFAVPPHRTGGITDALVLPDRGAEAPPPASSVPGPGSLVLIVTCAAIRGGRRRRQTSRFFTSRACSSI